MALPSGIVPKAITFGIASFFDGSIASGRVTISAPVNVIHTPTNRPIFSSDMTQSFVDGQATFNLCPTDAPGLNRIDWVYKAKIEITGAGAQPDPIYFTLPTAGPDTVDLDGLVTVPSSAGTPVSVNAVTVPSGGTDGQALIKSGTNIVWGTVAGGSAGAAALAPTATKTAAYTMAVGELAVMNVAGGATALTLPTAPADKAQVGFRAVGATTAVPLVVTRGGTDTIGDSGATSVSLPLSGEVTIYQYQATGTRWLPIANVKPLTALDARYPLVPKTAALAKLYAGLANRKVSPCRIAGWGSSSMEGIGADTTSNGFFYLLIRRLQAAYPSGIGTELGVVADEQGAWSTPVSTAVGVQGYDAAIGGTTSANFTTPGRISAVAALNPSAILYGVGSNDFYAGTDPATYKANMLAAIAATKTALASAGSTKPCVHVLFQLHERFDTSSHTYPWSAYGQALADIAAADPLNVAFIDVSGAFAQVGVPGADPLALTESTHVHLTNAGHAMAADLIAQQLQVPAAQAVTTGASAGSILAYDSFNRADAASLGLADSGQTWTPAGTTWAITSSRTTAGGNGHVYIDVARSDVDASVDVLWTGGATSVGVNFNFSDSNNRLAFYVDGGGIPTLAKVDAGTLTVLGTAGGISIASGQRRTLRAVSKGAAVTCYLDGTQAITYTLSTAEQTKFKAYSYVGLRQGAAVAVSFDNFLVKTPA